MTAANFSQATLHHSKTCTRGIMLGVAALLAATLATVGCGSSNTNNNQKSTQITKALWVANGTNVVEFLPSQLTAGASDPAPHLAINSSVFGAPRESPSTSNGNLWVIDGGTVAAGGGVKPALEEFHRATAGRARYEQRACVRRGDQLHELCVPAAGRFRWVRRPLGQRQPE